MDKVIKANIKRFLDNVGIMYGLVKSYYENENEKSANDKVVDILITQHALNKGVLEDLGYVSDESKEIRRLYEQVRELEAKVGQRDDLNFSVIANFIEDQSNKFSKHISSFGIYSSAGLEVGHCISAKINFFSLDEVFSDRGLTSYRNESELEEARVKHDLKLKALKENFDILKTTTFGNTLHIKYTENNLAKLIKICEEFFNDSIMNVRYELRSDDAECYFSEFSFSVLCTDSARNINEALKRR